MSMRRFGVLALLGAGIELVSAQTTTLGASPSILPTSTWAPAPVCSQGNSWGGPAPYGGVYEDPLGTFYQVECGYQFSGLTFYDTAGYNLNANGYTGAGQGTTAQGIVTCFWGCSQRPECIGFTYAGTVNAAANSGSGVCYNYLNGTQGTLAPAAGNLNGNPVYASGLILQGSPGTLCPLYDGNYFTDGGGTKYLISCGYRPNTAIGGGSTPMSTTMVNNAQSCLSACGAAGTAACNHAAYSYSAPAPTSAEPAPYTNAHAFGSCTFFIGTPTPSGAGQAKYAMYARSTPAVTTTTTPTTAPTTTVSPSPLAHLGKVANWACFRLLVRLLRARLVHCPVGKGVLSLITSVSDDEHNDLNRKYMFVIWIRRLADLPYSRPPQLLRRQQ